MLTTTTKTTTTWNFYRCNRARPGKGGILVILLLAVLVGGGLYAYRQGWIPGAAKSETPPPGAPSTVSAPGVPGDASPSVSSRPPSVRSAPSGPASIFDDSGSGGSGNASTPTPAPRPSLDTGTPLPPAPPAPDLPALEAAARDAERTLVTARSEGVRKLKTTPTFAARQAEVDRLAAALGKARASGTPQEKVAASGAWNKARIALEADYDAALAADPAYSAAKVAAQRATEALRAAKLQPK